MTAMCPHCGYNLLADRPIADGEWEIALDAVRWRGAALPLSRAERAAVYSVAKGAGGTVQAGVIGARVSDASGDPARLGNVYLNRARRKARHLPIENVRDCGYRWLAAETPELRMRREREALESRLDFARRDVARIERELAEKRLGEAAEGHAPAGEGA